MRSVKYLLLCTLFFFSVGTLATTSNHYDLPNPGLMQVANTLPSEGVLKETEDEFVYLKVSDDYLDKLFPLLKVNNAKMDEAKIGAHVSFISKHEIDFHSLQNKIPIGKVFHFKVIALNKVVIDDYCYHGRNSQRTWYVITIDSPELDALRRSLWLPKARNPYHISIAKDFVFLPDQQCSRSFF